jgi:hypothetical protein
VRLKLIVLYCYTRFVKIKIPTITITIAPFLQKKHFYEANPLFMFPFSEQANKTADFNGVPVLAASRLYQSFFDKRTLPEKSRR